MENVTKKKLKHAEITLLFPAKVTLLEKKKKDGGGMGGRLFISVFCILFPNTRLFFFSAVRHSQA